MPRGRIRAFAPMRGTGSLFPRFRRANRASGRQQVCYPGGRSASRKLPGITKVMTGPISYAVRALDAVTARAYLAMFRERPGLVTLLFHSLFADAAEVRLGHIDPQQCTTVGDFAAVLEHFRAAGYRFVSPADVSSGLDPSARHVMVTFDDGYFNNVRALPVMKRCDVPTTFFISTGHVRDGRCFWWDVLYRERSARGASLAQIRAEGAALKRLPYAQIEE